MQSVPISCVSPWLSQPDLGLSTGCVTLSKRFNHSASDSSSVHSEGLLKIMWHNKIPGRDGSCGQLG